MIASTSIVPGPLLEKKPDAMDDVASQALVLAPVCRQLELQPVLLDRPKLVIGSDAACAIRLNVPGVQAQHVMILRGPRQIVLKAWDARTWLNGGPVTAAPLRAGDVLAVGPIEFRVRTATVDDLLMLPRPETHPESGTGTVRENVPPANPTESSPAATAPATRAGSPVPTGQTNASRTSEPKRPAARQAVERLKEGLKEYAARPGNQPGHVAPEPSEAARLEEQLRDREAEFARQSALRRKRLASLRIRIKERHGELRADFARLATELSDESRRIESERTQLECERAKDRGAIADARPDDEQLREREAQIAQHAALRRARLAAVRTRIGERRRELRKEVAHLTEELREESCRIESERAQLERERAAACETLAETRRGEDETHERHAELERRVALRRARLSAVQTRLKERHRELREEFARRNQELIEKSRRIEMEATQEWNRLEAERSQFEKERSSALRITTDDQNDVGSQRKHEIDTDQRAALRRARLSAVRSRLNERRRELDNEFQQLKEQRCRLEAERAQFDQERSAATETAAQLRHDEGSLREREAQMTRLAALRRTRLSAMRARLKERRIELRHEFARLREAAAQLQIERSQLGEIGEQTGRFEAERLHLEQERTAAREKAADLLRNEECLREREAQSARLISLRQARLSAVRTRLQERRRELDEEATRLKEEWSRFESERSRIERIPQTTSAPLDAVSPPAANPAADAVSRQHGPQDAEWDRDADRFKRLFQTPQRPAVEETPSPQTQVQSPELTAPVVRPNEKTQPDEDANVDESVSAYMEQLLKRMRGTSDVGAQVATRAQESRTDMLSPSKSILEPAEMFASQEAVSTKDASRLEAPVSEPVVIVNSAPPERQPEPRDARREEQINRLRTGVGSLREVANLSARQAVAKHAWKRIRKSVRITLPLIVLSLLIGGAMFAIGEVRGQYYAQGFGVLALGVLALAELTFKYWRLKRADRTRNEALPRRAADEPPAAPQISASSATPSSGDQGGD